MNNIITKRSQPPRDSGATAGAHQKWKLRQELVVEKDVPNVRCILKWKQSLGVQMKEV